MSLSEFGLSGLDLNSHEIDGLVRVSKTPEAYEPLFAREAGIIFVVSPSKAQREAAKPSCRSFRRFYCAANQPRALWLCQ